MWAKWSVLTGIVLLSYVHVCCSIKCADKEVLKFNKGVIRDTTCEGNLCMNFDYSRVTYVDKTCITTGAFNITSGCVQIDPMNDKLIVCYCDTDMCNAGAPSGTRTIMKELNCSSTFEDSITTHSMTAACSTHIVEQNGVRTVKNWAINKFEDASLLPISQTAPLESFGYQFGIVHTISGVEKDVLTHNYRCLEDNCNDEVHGSLKIKTDVSCNSTDGETCQGEFCVFATNGTDNYLSYCLSTEAIKTKDRYEVGVFKYKTATFYLCKEDYCNTDQRTANMSVAAKERLSNLNGETTEIPTVVVEEVNHGKQEDYNIFVFFICLLLFNKY